MVHMKSIPISMSIKSMLHLFIVILLTGVFFTSASVRPAYAEDAATPKGKKAPAVIKITPEVKRAMVAESFKKDFPNAKFTNIQESGIEGLYEVITGVNIIYYSPAAGRILFGDMLDKTGRNLTAEKRQPLVAQHDAEMARSDAETAKIIKDLPLGHAIKVGNGKNTVIEFTDIDCPYCRKAEEFFKLRTDVTRYVFLLPLEQIHPKSMAKAREVLCAKDKAKAYQDAMAGGLDSKDLKGCSDKGLDSILTEYKTSAMKLGVTGTPMMWVNDKKVNGADTVKIEKYLFSAATVTV